MYPAANQKGFTLIELLLAMVIFSFGFLVVVAATIALMQMYQASTAQRNTQASAQLALDRISQASRDATAIFTDPAGDNICVAGPNLVYYITGLNTPTNTLFEGNWGQQTGNPDCGGEPEAGLCPDCRRQITSADTEVVGFKVAPVGHPAANGSYNSAIVTLTLKSRAANVVTSYDANNDPHYSCSPSSRSCALTTLSTMIGVGRRQATTP